MIVQAFAHLGLAVDAKHLEDFGMLDLRLDQDLGVVAVVELAHDLTRKLEVWRLVDSHGNNIRLIKNDVCCH